MSTLAGETLDLARARERRKHFANIQSKREPIAMTSILKLKLTMIVQLPGWEETDGVYFNRFQLVCRVSNRNTFWKLKTLLTSNYCILLHTITYCYHYIIIHYHKWSI